MLLLSASELYPFCFTLVAIKIFSFVYSLNINGYVFYTILPRKTLQALYCLLYTCMACDMEYSS